ncbi:MAG: molecular chaperone Hsp90 [Frankia sp.]|nr:molecular chaperone Hsp90 [Frankia sp.]
MGGPPGPADDSADPFGTAAIRGRVLDAWAASPARFREDANAEEDAALGAYRDRLVVELLQNAVDAAVAAGVPGRVRLVLAGRQLEVANTGAPLTADGVEALSTLRASAKRDTSAIGRFGAGFAAVLAVSDDPSIVSRPARGAAPVGVSWSKARTVAAVHEIGAAGLRAELARRGGAVPVLRLPFAEPAPLPPPAGYDTVVRLPLRDADAVATARQLLTDFDPTLLLVLPGLAEVVLDIDDEVRTHTCVWEHRGRLAGQAEKVREAGPAGFGPPAADPVETALDATLEVALLDGQHWRGCVRAGTIPAALLADRPVEERARTGYAARAMVPDDGWPKGVPRVVRAPQPTDEPLSLPVLVSVELPLEPSRRHTVAGPLRDWLTDRLAEAIAALAVHIGTAGTEAAADAAGLAAAPAEVTLAGLVAELDQPSGGAAGEQRPAVERDPLVPPDPLAALELVPTGLPAGPVDGRLRDALHRLLPRTGMMPGGRLGRECVVCDLGPATDAVTALLAAPHPATPDGHGAASRPDVVDVAFDLGTPAALGADPDAGFDDLAPTGLANRYRDGGPIVAGLLPAQYAARRWRPALDALGVRRLDSAGLVEALAGARRPPSWWAALYATLISAPDRDALGALPVPVAVVAGEDSWDDDAELADPTPPGPGGDAEVGPAGSGRSGAPGLRVRMVTGPRGVLLPTDELDVVALAASGLPLRVAHPQACAGAARDALRTLGAVEGTPAGVLRDPAVREAVADSDPDDDPQDLMALATAVLALVRDAGLTQREVALGLDWLGDLLLPDADGEFVAASELLIEGGPLDRVVSDDAPFATLDPRVAQAWPAEVLEAVGVLRSFGVLYATDVPLDPDEPVLLDLDDSDTWVEEAVDSPALAPARRAAARVGAPGAPLVLSGFAAVRDLELVDPAAWPEALAELARPPLRDVVLGEEPSYTRWWLSRHALLPVATSPEQDDEDGEDGDGEGGGGWARAVRRDAGEVVRLPPPELRLPGAAPLLAGLFAPAAPLPMVDDDFLRALGCRYTLDDVLGDLPGVLDLLDRLGDAERDIPWPSARALYVAAVTAATRLAAGPDGDPHGTLADGRLDPPLTVRTPLGVVPTEDAVVLDAPDLLTLLGDVAPLRVPLDRAAEVGYVLGVPLASAVSDCPVVADAEGDETTVRHAPDATPYVEHTRLTVVDLSGRPVRTPWRVVGGIGGEIHVDAAAGTDALARALAWRAGTWYRRHALAAALRDPQGRAFRDAEDDLDDL